MLWYNIHIQTFKVEMKGRKRSLCSPPSYRLSGARFEVATRIYTCLPPQTQHTIVMLTSAKTFKVLLHREQKKTEEIKLLTIPLLNRCPNRRFSINASATSFTYGATHDIKIQHKNTKQLDITYKRRQIMSSTINLP